MSKRFRLNPQFCFLDKNIDKPKSACVFDYYSIQHFYWQGFAYLLIHRLLNIQTLKNAIILIIVLTILHVIEEYLDNVSKLSLQGIIIDNIGPLIDKRIDTSKRMPDDDYLDNSIGDVLSGVISCIILVAYWNRTGKLPIIEYSIFLIPVIYLLLKKKYKFIADK